MQNNVQLLLFRNQAEFILCIGARVTLITNLCVRLGLMNGAIGTIRHVVYAPTTFPPHNPECIIVQFDRYLGVSVDPIDSNCAPIFLTKLKSKHDDQYRMAFPLRLAYLKTVHKCQGQTITSSIIVDMTSTDFAPGLTFVALSRVTKMSDLQLSSFPYDKLQEINKDSTKPDLLNNLIRLKTSALKLRQKLNYHFGMESLQQSIRDLQAILHDVEHSALTVALATSARGCSRIIPAIYPVLGAAARPESLPPTCKK